MTVQQTISPTPEHSEAVMRLFAQHQRWLFGYLTALMGNHNDAEDVMQEVSVVMWQQHHKFEIGTNFVSWLSVIAYHQAQKYWRTRNNARCMFNDELLEQLTEAAPRQFELHEARRQALAGCVAKLREPDRELVRYAYGERKRTAKSVAAELGRSEGAVYKALNRIRKSLLQCINQRIATEGMV